MEEYINQIETQWSTGEEDMPHGNRSNEEVMFDEIVADINEKLEEANYYYKKTEKILKDLTKEL